MKKILYIVTLICITTSILGQPYQIGDVYTAPNGSQGIVFYLFPDGSGGWAVALNDAPDRYPWGPSSDIPGLSNHSENENQLVLMDTTGYTSTQTIRLAQNNSHLYAAGWVDFGNGWYLPTPAQLRILFGMLPFIEPSLINAGGTTLKDIYTENGGSYQAEYWSSVECSGDKAWCVSFYYGRFYPTNKQNSLRFVRAVHTFSNTRVIPNPAVSYSWSTGDTTQGIAVTPAQTSTYTVTVSTPSGCRDEVEQTIVVKEMSNEDITQFACDSCRYNGILYTESGDYIQRFTNVAGCDSVLNLHLTISPTAYVEVEHTACDSYEWCGEVYSANGYYTKTLSQQNGCDSIVRMHLMIEQTPHASILTQTDTICSGESVELQSVIPSSGHVIPGVPDIAVGDILCTDESIVKPSAWPVEGKTAQGIVFYVDESGNHGWAIHLQNQSTSISWAGYQTPGYNSDIPDLNNFSHGWDAVDDMEGYQNTQIIRNAGDATSYPAAYAMDFDNGWYLPAAGQLNIMYPTIVLLNNSLQIVNGTLFPMNAGWKYLSSTEFAAGYIWYLDSTGHVGVYDKGTSFFNVRSVRDF